MRRGAALDKFYQRARGDFPAPVPPLTWLRYDGADLSGLLVRAADYGLLEVLGPLLLGARVPMIIHRAGLAAIARPEDEAEDHDSADDGTSTTIQFQLMQKKRRASKGGKPPGRGSQIMIPR